MFHSMHQPLIHSKAWSPATTMRMLFSWLWSMMLSRLQINTLLAASTTKIMEWHVQQFQQMLISMMIRLDVPIGSLILRPLTWMRSLQEQKIFGPMKLLSWLIATTADLTAGKCSMSAKPNSRQQSSSSMKKPWQTMILMRPSMLTGALQKTTTSKMGMKLIFIECLTMVQLSHGKIFNQELYKEPESFSV